MSAFHARRGELWYLHSQKSTIQRRLVSVLLEGALFCFCTTKEMFSGSHLFKIKQLDQILLAFAGADTRIKLGWNYSSRVVKNKSFFFTIGVTAHLIGQASEAPFTPEFLGQAGTLEHSPLQTCHDGHRRDWTLPSFTLDHPDLTQEPTDTTSCNKHLLLYAASFNYAAPSDLWLCLRLGSAQLSTADSKVALAHGTFSIQSSQRGQSSYHLPVSKITAGSQNIF